MKLTTEGIALLLLRLRHAMDPARPSNVQDLIQQSHATIASLYSELQEWRKAGAECAAKLKAMGLEEK